MAKSKYIVPSQIDVRETHAKTLSRLSMDLAMEMARVGSDIKEFLNSRELELPIQHLINLSVILRQFEPQTTCKHCGKAFTSKGRGSVQHFCSPECRANSYKARRRKEAVMAAVAIEPITEGEPIAQGKETPDMYEQPMIAQIEVIPTVVIEPTTEAAGEPITEAVKVRGCDFCGKEFEVKAKYPNKRFCSDNCRAKGHKAARVANEAAGKTLNRVVGVK